MSRWSAEVWSALGTMLVGLGVLVTGAWAVFNYRRSRKAQEAQLLRDAFDTFYMQGQFTAIRLMLEYNYRETLAPLLERRIAERAVPVSQEEQRILCELDNLLNFLELLEYQREKGQFSEDDRDTLFDYWSGLIKSDETAALRCYLAHFGFERIAELMGTEQARFVFTYGSLRADVRPNDDGPPLMGTALPPGFDSSMFGTGPLNGVVVSEHALLSGYLLFDTGLGYPAAVRERIRGNIAAGGVTDVPAVVGTLWEFPEHVDMEVVLAVLDRYEGIGRLPYRRHLVRVKALGGSSSGVGVLHDAWAYVYKEPPLQGEQIIGGDWATRAR